MYGDVRVFYSADHIISEPGADDPLNESMLPKYLRSLDPLGLLPGELRLKLGCPLILL